jgi:hypothetical protein
MDEFEHKAVDIYTIDALFFSVHATRNSSIAPLPLPSQP